jgi:hypothetical protein
MMAKYIANVGGELQEVVATVASAGAADAGKVLSLDGAGRIDASVLPIGVGQDAKTLITSENLAANDWVQVWNNAGVATIRKADASNGREAHGFVLVATVSPAAATMYKEGTNAGLAGLTPGAPYYLSAATAGGAVAVPPTAAGQISQRLGEALSATEIDCNIQRKITLA